MVNVGNGNVLVQADDVDIHERGIDLAFRRTYNSLSQHNWSNSDTSVVSNFGNGWTNTFDAHIAYYTSGGTSYLSVYDIDGARYDYVGYNNTWVAPPGMQGTSIGLIDNCHYQWTKKNGTAYVFYPPDYSARGCTPSGSGLNGRVAEIIGRNSNNYVTFTYGWQNGIVDSKYLGSISVMHQDGQQLTLGFTLTDGQTPCNGSGPCELRTLMRPDGQQIVYSYDGSGNLTQVNFPGNNVASQLWETFGYTTGSRMSTISSPRYAYSYSQTGGNPTEGSTTNFVYFGTSGQLQYMQRQGVVNFAPADGTGLTLQPGIATGVQPYYQLNFSGYAATPACTSGLSGATAVITNSGASSTTSVTDSDGRSTLWTVDGCWRLTQTQEFTGPSASLIRSQGWDNENDLIASTDYRGNETDYAYDANGNVTKVGLPLVGTFRPTSVYSYDPHNNVTAYCDPVESNSIGQNWSTNPGITGDSLCPSQSGAQRFTWSTSASSIFGFLTDMYTAAYDGAGNGYHTHFTYDSSRQGGNDYGLPTTVAGDSFTQQNQTTVAPTQNFNYDTYGRLTCYAKSVEASGTIDWWRLTYDNLNRTTAVAEPDDSSLAATVSCPNSASPGIASSHIVSTTTYYADGAVASTQSPSEYAASVSTTYTYDADGNQSSKTAHYNCTVSSCTAGTTTNWYDGEDRLVEVKYPHDTSDYYSFDWLTRYLYDLTKGGTVSFGATGAFKAYGDLYETQEYLPTTPYSGWTALKGTAYDAMDRAVTEYSYVHTAEPATLQHTTLAYDTTSATYGYLSTKTDALGQTATYSYDADGHVSNVTYGGDGGVTPAETTTYDADGRVIDVQSSAFSSPLQYQYDTDGKLKQAIEPSGLPSAATLNYSYYPNGWRKQTSATASGLAQSATWQYDYDAAGRTSLEQVTYGGTTAQVTRQYTPTGRMTTMANNSGSAARQVTYDVYGRIATDSGGPGAPYGAFKYDDEGEVTSYNGFSTTVTQLYNVRGELTQQSFANFTPGCGVPQGNLEWEGVRQKGADGYMVPLTWGADDTSGSTCSWSPHNASWDVLTGVTTAGDTTTTTYDAAGRESGGTIQWDNIWNCGDTQCEDSGNGSNTRQYDAENHLIGQTYSNWQTYSGSVTCPSDWTGGSGMGYMKVNIGLSYKWGPNGHVVEAGNTHTGSMLYETLHWDGDEVLFTTNGAGTVDDLKLDGDADILLSGGTASTSFTQRDFSGATGDPPNASRELCADTSTAPISQPGPDGISDGYNIFQGVRNYDPAVGTWSTPDAYEGEVSDPMSQHAYMWNRNNSFLYEDPSGYLSIGDVAKGIYNFVVGDDISTLRDNHASAGAKIVAAASIASNFLAPEIKTGGLAVKAIVKGGLQISEHAAIRGAQRGITSRMMQAAVDHGSAHFDTMNGTVNHILETAGGNSLVVGRNPITNTITSAMIDKRAPAKLIGKRLASGRYQ